MEFIYKNVLLRFLGGSENYTVGGGATKIFEINLLRTCFFILKVQ